MTAAERAVAGARAARRVDVWVPDDAERTGGRQVPEGFSFAGRPQLVARLPRAGGGRSLLFNAHTVDERVPVDDLVACAQAYVLAAMRFCGTA